MLVQTMVLQPPEHGLTLILAWISNFMPSKVCDEITHPFLNFNGGSTVSLGMDD